MSHPRGGIKDTTPILGRMDHRLFPNDLRHMKLALADYCIDCEQDPGDLTMSPQLLCSIMPYLQLQSDAWLAMTLSEMNLNRTAIKGFYDCIRNQLADIDSLKEKIKETKEDQALCQAMEQKQEPAQSPPPKKEPPPPAPTPKNDDASPAPPKKSPP